jgi:RNA recognition motif-containing protein
MFVGGLSWDTTDGTLSLAHTIPSLLQCHVHFTNSLNCRRVMPFFFSLCLPSFKPDGLRNYFSEFGKVDACTIVRYADGKSRGFAFLTFEDPASVNAVMIWEHFLDGKAVRAPNYLS